jgi:metallophosphoesterase superfamily enzyme
MATSPAPLPSPLPSPSGPRLSRADCGGLRLTLVGVRTTLRASGALWIERARTLVVADLHLEKGSAYGAKGQLLPPYDTRETLARLEAEVEALDPQVVVLLGDSFHDGAPSRPS